MIALFEHVFKRAQILGMAYIDMGVFWKKGEPSSWKGFSAFKSKFGTQIVDSPPVAIRIELVGILKYMYENVTHLFQKVKNTVQCRLFRP